MSKLGYRGLVIDDKDWLVETANDPDAAKYAVSVYPVTEHEAEVYLKKELDSKDKYIVAEVGGEPAGGVSVWFREGSGRDRHIAWLAILVRRKYWGKGVGSALMREATKVARDSGCRRLMLGTIEGNERAIRLYKKSGFKTEVLESKGVYIEGSWRKNYLMGLDLAPCEPMLDAANRQIATSRARSAKKPSGNLRIRQLMNRDLDEVNRLQNCAESTKSSYRIPPITREETKRWYETLDSEKGRHCLACFKNNKILGYLHFRAYRLPFPCLKFEEIVIDFSQQPYEAANALVSSIKEFTERYWYQRVFAYIPETSVTIAGALEKNGFHKTGSMKCYYYIDGYYVNSAAYEYPHQIIRSQ